MHKSRVFAYLELTTKRRSSNKSKDRQSIPNPNAQLMELSLRKARTLARTRVNAKATRFMTANLRIESYDSRLHEPFCLFSSSLGSTIVGQVRAACNSLGHYRSVLLSWRYRIAQWPRQLEAQSLGQ